jgi:myosin heavy subunit
MALPYTRTGDIVIACNPYQWLTYLYTEEQQLLYAKKLVWENSDLDNRKILEPHVYESSALAYKGLAARGTSQSLLVSGESGAGKTETVKICMNHMASLQRGPVEAGDMAEGVNPVVQRVVDSNPLLEAFGNAKTSRNDNSSRFGKYILLQFDRDENAPHGEIPLTKLAGSKCEVYLLEKSRVVSHEESEGTYHVMYQLCCASNEQKAVVWSGLKDTNYDSFKIVGTPLKERAIDKMCDSDHYTATTAALALVGIEGEHHITIMRAIAIVLTLGNLTFGEKDGDAEASSVTSAKVLENVVELMEIPTKELTDALTERTMRTAGEVFKVPLKPELAKDTCEAWAKEIYNKLFLWLVRACNAATCAEENYDGERKTGFGFIGLLDIFGFESFKVNGFEQLCINYANEKLQQKFTNDIFQAVMEEYKFEGIALDDISYDDNSDVLELIEHRGGLLMVLNEESVRPKGSDKEFVHKAKQGNKDRGCLIADLIMGPLDFGIHHYAGKVLYTATGFLARNQDTLSQDLVEVSKLASNDIIANHMQNEKMMKDYGEKKEEAAPAKKKKGGAGDSLWTKFKNQLNALMKSLALTESRYIRCVKPNTLKQKCVMQHMTTIEQLRCAGVVAAVTISRSAFPNRLDHKATIERFKVLSKVKKAEGAPEMDPKDEIVQILKPAMEKFVGADDGKASFVVGLSRCYFKMGALEFLEAERMKAWDVWAVDIQKVARGWLSRRVAKEAKRLAALALEEARLAELARIAELERLEQERLAEIERVEQERIAAEEAAAEAILQAERDRIWEAEREEREAREAAEAAAAAILQAAKDKREAEEAAAEAILQAERDKVAAEEAAIEAKRIEEEAIAEAKRIEEEAIAEAKRIEEEAAAEAKRIAEEEAEEARLAELYKAERAAKAAAEAQRILEEAEAEAKRIAEEAAEAARVAEEEKVERARVKEENRVNAERIAEEKAAYEEANAASIALEKKREGVRQMFKDQMEEIKVKMAEADEEGKVRVQQAKDDKEVLEKEVEELKVLTSDDNKKALMEPKKIAAQQKKKLEESAKMIDFLKKENKTIRKAHDKMSDKFDVVKTSNEKLLKVNEDVGGSFENIDASAARVNEKNESLIAALEKAKNDNLQLKEDCMKRQEDYMTQAETRLEYQKTMARILNMIQETSKEPQIVEDAVVIALECESESKSVMAALEAETEDDDDDDDDDE